MYKMKREEEKEEKRENSTLTTKKGALSYDLTKGRSESGNRQKEKPWHP
jgi:hypothetical protein